MTRTRPLATGKWVCFISGRPLSRLCPTVKDNHKDHPYNRGVDVGKIGRNQDLRNEEIRRNFVLFNLFLSFVCLYFQTNSMHT